MVAVSKDMVERAREMAPTGPRLRYAVMQCRPSLSRSLGGAKIRMRRSSRQERAKQPYARVSIVRSRPRSIA